MTKILETDIASAVVKYLQCMGWEVYQEVSLGYASRRADMVATRQGLIWVIESKTTLSLAVLEQAWNWNHYAHYISVAVPHTHTKGAGFAKKICYDNGIGLFYMKQDWSNNAVSVQIEPRFHRKIDKRLQKVLREEHKTFAAAGNADNNYYTPFRVTSTNVQNYVRGHPGCTLKEMMLEIKHHYRSEATARNVIPQWIAKGVIPNVRIERDSKVIRLFHVEQK